MLYEYDDAADFSKTLPNFDGCHDKIEKTVMSERMQLGFSIIEVTLLRAKVSPIWCFVSH